MAPQLPTLFCRVGATGTSVLSTPSPRGLRETRHMRGSVWERREFQGRVRRPGIAPDPLRKQRLVLDQKRSRWHAEQSRLSERKGEPKDAATAEQM